MGPKTQAEREERYARIILDAKGVENCAQLLEEKARSIKALASNWHGYRDECCEAVECIGCESVLDAMQLHTSQSLSAVLAAVAELDACLTRESAYRYYETVESQG